MDIKKMLEVKDLKNEKLDLHLAVTLKSDLFEKEVDDQIKKTAKTVSMDGFRKGKVPVSVLKKRHGDAFRIDTLKEVLTHTLRHVAQERNIKAAGEPDISDVINEPGKDIAFTIKYSLLPEITMPEWANICLDAPILEVSDEDIEAEVQKLIKFSSTFDKKTTAKAKDGDQVILDAIGSVDGEAFEGGKLSGHKLVLGSNTFIAGFEDQLIGSKAGDNVKVAVTFPADYHQKSLASKDAIFDCTIVDVYKPTKPDLDDEFAKRFNAENIEDLRQKISKNIANSYKLPIFRHMKRTLFDILDDKFDFDVPDMLLNREKESLLQHTAFAAADDEIEEVKGKSQEEKNEYYNTLARRRVRLGLVLAEYATGNQLSVSQDDLNSAVIATARQFPGQESRIFDFYQKNPYAVESLKGSILEEKAVRSIFDSKIILKDKKYTRDALDKLLESD